MVGIFGFFMGVPVFNIIPGIFAGYYAGRKSKMNMLSYHSFRRSLRKTNLLTSSILLIFMIVSAIIALTDKYTGANLSGMFNLQHQITRTELLFFIFIGAVFLLYVQNLLSSVLGKLAYSNHYNCN
jgi:H+/Cl- antiporter ClcA